MNTMTLGQESHVTVDDVGPSDSISQVDSEGRSRAGDQDSHTIVIEAKDLKDAEKYYTAVRDAVMAVPIKGAIDEEPEISATRF